MAPSGRPFMHAPCPPGQVSLKENFITIETCRDVLISCNGIILAAAFHRLACAEQGICLAWDPSRFSSRFDEYTFQFLRARQAGGKFTALSAMQGLHILEAQTELELESGLRRPDAKRGAPASVDQARHAMS